MLSDKMQEALNAQINAEQYSAQLYLAMSASCERRSFKGFASWLRLQAGEETAHAMKLIGYLLDRGGRLALKEVPAPPAEHGGVIQVFEQALKHEQANTAHIDALFEQARAERDHASEIALQWYVTEQVEEEATIHQVVEHLHAVGDQGGGIWYLDSRMGKRGKE